MPGSGSPDPGLLRQRERLRRELRRANLAWGVLLIVITALTFGVIWKASQSTREADRASRSALEARTQAARAEAELWNARLAEARTARISSGPGDRTKAEALIRQCSASTSLSATQRQQLRAEAIRLCAMVDILPPETWVTQRVILTQNWDPPMRRYLQSFNTNRLELKSHPSGQTLATLLGPQGATRQEARFSRDGRYLVSVFRKPSVAICWRLDDQTIVYSNRTISVDYLDVPFFSPDNKTLAVVTTNGLELNPLEVPGPVVIVPRRSHFQFSPDSRWLASVQSTNLEIWSALSGRLLLQRGVDFRASCLAWHPYGTRLALAGERGKLVVWDLRPKDAPPEAPSETAPAIPSEPQSSSPAAPGQMRAFQGHTGAIVGLWFSPDGTMLLSYGWDNLSILWDTVTGRKLLAESRMNLTGGFSSNGEHVMANIEMGTRQGPARLVNRQGFRPILQAGSAPRSPIGMTMSGDRRLVATDHVDHSIIWDRSAGVEIARVAGRSPLFSTDSQTLFTIVPDAVHQFALGSLSRHSQVTNRLTHREVFHRDRGKNDVLNSASLAPDGRTLVVAASEGGVVLVDLKQERPAQRFKPPAHYASLSADGLWLVTQMHNREAWLINLTNAAKPRLLGYHLNAAFSPDGTSLALSTEKTLVLLERNPDRTNGWSRRWQVPMDIGAGGPAPIAFTPDGTTIATPHNRYDLQLRDLRNGQELVTLSAPDPVQIDGKESMGFSTDGQFLSALRTDGQLIEWNLALVRSELARLGLAWTIDSGIAPTNAPTNRGTTEEHPTSIAPASEMPSPSRLSVPSVAAAAAGLFALVAGTALFLHQRRTMAAYARAEELAEAQQKQLALAQEALFQGQKMEALGTLAAGVAHDFNNLLSIIRMSNQLVARATKPDGNTLENIDAIERAVKQGKAIVDSMLGYSRRPVDSITEFSVTKAVSDTVALLSRQFLSGLRLNLELAPDCPPIHGSPARLEQVLLNLVLNASEAMHGSGSLSVSAQKASSPHAGVLTARTAPTYVAIEVTDTGPGIPADVLPRIFEPFFTTKTAGSRLGTGLGLSLVYSIARQDGWGLDVTSPPGKGATFKLILPALPGGGHRLPTSASTPLEARVRAPKPT